MRLRTTLVLLVVLLGLGAYVYWIEMPSAEQEAKQKKLFEIAADDAVELSLLFQDRSIELKKTGEAWRLLKPLEVAADAATVKTLVTGIVDCEVKKELEDPGDLAQYGLDKPFVTLRLKLADKELPEVAVGKNTPVGFNTYIQKLDDKKVLLANSACRTGLDKQVNDLRDKTILSFVDSDVQKFALQGADKDLRLVRKGEAWEIEQAANLPADATTVRSFLSTLRSMRAVDFPSNAPADVANYGLDAPRLRITLFLGKDLAEKQVLIGGENPAKKGEILVKTSGDPTVYSVSDWVWRDLSKGPADFRDKTVLAVDRAKLTGVELRRADGGIVKLLGNDKDGWQVEGADGKPAATAINQWLGDVDELKGYEVVSDEPDAHRDYGLDQPLLTINLTGEGGATAGTILIAEKTNDQGGREYYVTASGKPTVFKIRDYLITRLNKQAKDFLEVPTPTPGGPTPTAPAVEGYDEDVPMDEGELGIDEHIGE